VCRFHVASGEKLHADKYSSGAIVRGVAKLASITFWSLAFSYWFDKPWFHYWGKLAAVLLIPSSWGSQLDALTPHHQRPLGLKLVSSPISLGPSLYRGRVAPCPLPEAPRAVARRREAAAKGGPRLASSPPTKNPNHSWLGLGPRAHGAPSHLIQ
jgi:hypothetical protein